MHLEVGNMSIHSKSAASIDVEESNGRSNARTVLDHEPDSPIWRGRKEGCGLHEVGQGDHSSLEPLELSEWPSQDSPQKRHREEKFIAKLNQQHRRRNEYAAFKKNSPRNRGL